MPDLSVLIPGRNEQFLRHTIDDVLENMRGDTEVIAVCDGSWPLEPIPDHPKVQLIYHATAKGQRASVNEAARLSSAKYIMKLDAHCSVAEGFDVELVRAGEELGRDVTQIPRMFNLHAFDWVCDHCGGRTYQGPKPQRCENKTCAESGKGPSFRQEMVWKPRHHKRTDFARFDNTLHFQYWRDYDNRPQAKGDIADVMCFVGASFFMRLDRYFEIGGLDEAHGSWGQMGVEISCKSWLSGGRQVVNKKTWFAHMFRTQDGFGFPYPISGSDVDKARKRSRQLWVQGTWPLAKHSLDWLIQKFSPVPEWNVPEPVTTAGVTKGLLYYSDCRGDETILQAARNQLERCRNGHRLVSVTLDPVTLGRNIVLPLERGTLTMFRQILAGLEALDTDIVFLVEHDVLYHPSHFEFVPPRQDVFYYNEAVWKVDAETGRAIFYFTKQTSGLCAYRSLLLEHYRKRVDRVAKEGFTRAMGFEPGTHRLPRGIDDHPAERWMSPIPNIDIRHGKNLTPSRWDPSEFRNPKACLGWNEAPGVPGWGLTKGRFREFLQEQGRTP